MLASEHCYSPSQTFPNACCSNRLDWPGGAESRKSVKAVAKLRRLRDYLRQQGDSGSLQAHMDSLVDLVRPPSVETGTVQDVDTKRSALDTLVGAAPKAAAHFSAVAKLGCFEYIVAFEVLSISLEPQCRQPTG